MNEVKTPSPEELEAMNSRASELFIAAAESLSELGEYITKIAEQYPNALFVHKDAVRHLLAEVKRFGEELDRS